MKLQLRNKIEEYQGTYNKHIGFESSSTGFVESSKAEYDAFVSEVNKKRTWLECIYVQWCDKRKIPCWSADEVISFIVDLRSVLKLHDENRLSIQSDISKMIKATGDIPLPNAFLCNTVNNKTDFLKKLYLYEKWLNNYIDMWNLLDH